MRPKSAKEMDAVLRLDGPIRFEHFIKRVVDEEEAWGLWDAGWALMQTSDRVSVFPLWPAREYADLCRTGNWADYEAKEMPLAILLDEFLPKLAQQDARVGIFPTAAGKGVTMFPRELQDALRRELEKYA